MTFLHKLARRLALVGPVALGAVLGGCEGDRATGERELFAPSLGIVGGAQLIGTRAQTSRQAMVKDGPFRASARLGLQPVGATGTVVGGPVRDSADGKKRWQINFDSGPDGWVVNAYLIGATPVSTRFRLGARVQAAPGGANIRGGAILAAPLLGSQPAGATGTVTGGAALDSSGDGLVRWEIDFDGGSDGWAADGYLAAAPVVATVAASPASASLPAGASVQFSATVRDTAGTTITTTMTWTIRDTAIARVSAAGLVTGVAAGATLVIAASGGVADTVSLAVTPAPVHAGHYAAPGGLGTNDGSPARPWDLATALAGGGGRVAPGDTIWLRGGIYAGAFRSTVSGEAGAPVVVRQYPGERAIIDNRGSTSTALTVTGNYSEFRDFELTNTDPVRTVSFTGNGGRTHALYNRANFTKYLNLVVHDAGVAFYSEPVNYDIEIAGCIFYNNGWQGPDRGHGHALYLKSDAGPVVVRDNVIFNQYGYGVHVYSNPGSGAMRNIRLEGNVAFNNGTLATSPSANILMGGGDVATGAVIRNNLAYMTPGVAGSNVRVGSGTVLNGTVTVEGNTFAGGSPVVDVGYWTSAQFTGNTLIGAGTIVTLNDASTAAQTWSANTHRRDPAAAAWRYRGTSSAFDLWRGATALAATDVALTGVPAAPLIVVRPNPYEAGRAHVVVMNWPRLGAVSVSLEGVLEPGDNFEVRNAQDLFGAPVVSGIYAGMVTLPLIGVTPPVPVGLSASRAPRTGPEFDVFVVIRR